MPAKYREENGTVTQLNAKELGRMIRPSAASFNMKRTEPKMPWSFAVISLLRGWNWTSPLAGQTLGP
jgi:hypothetical protein